MLRFTRSPFKYRVIVVGETLVAAAMSMTVLPVESIACFKTFALMQTILSVNCQITTKKNQLTYFWHNHA